MSASSLPPARRVHAALLLALSPWVVGIGATAAASTMPSPATPVRAMGIAPRGELIAPDVATARDTIPAAEAGSDEEFRAQAESDVLRRLALPVRRESLRLWMPVAKGRPVVLDSLRPDPIDSAIPYVDYRFDGLSPDRGFYVVRATTLNGSELLWISRADGTRYAMHGNVHPSPGGRHLIVTHASSGAEFSGVVLWSLEDGRLVQRYRFQPTPEQNAISFRFLRWRDADTAELTQFAQVDPSTCGLGTVASTALLSRKTDHWILRSASGTRCEP